MLIDENIPNEQLRRARHLKGWTQSDLAEAVGTDFETVSRWERGITMPSAYFREHLCRVLELTPEELGFVQSLAEPLASSTTPGVFLAAAYADAEREFTTQLKAHLQAQGMNVSSSRTLRRQGAQNQSKVLQEAIHSAKTVILIASPEARSSRLVQKTLHIAGIYRTPLCAVWIDGENWQECLPPGCGELCATIDARERNDQYVFDEIETMLIETWPGSNEAEDSITPAKESATLTVEPRNPYKGLKAFRSEDRHDYFGRDTLVDELVVTLHGSLTAPEKHTGSARLLAIVGPSGSGKSSVVMAGLLPRLQEGALPGSQHWVYLDPLLPGAHPLESLAVLLAKHFPDKSLKTLREDLEDDSTFGLHLQTSLLAKSPATRVVLFIDQFEEIFTQTISEERRQHFLDVLITAVTELQGPTILILTLRADFYDRPMHYPELFQLLETRHSFVLPMTLKQLRDVIEKPAGLPDVRLTFEDDLVSDLLFEMHEQAGALPLLQFTLDQLFQRRDGHQLTMKAYQEIGGLKGAVAKHAEQTYASLPSEEHRKLARFLFLRLIDPGATAQDTIRRRIPHTELALPNPKETVILAEVIRAFTTARLLTTNTISGVATVEVSHEAVIREWTRLADWLDEAREDVHLQRTISEDVAAWEQSGRSRDRLYRGSQLKEARAWAVRNIPSGYEEAFLQASVASRARFLISVIAVVLIVVSSVGGTSWILTHQPIPLDPTRVSTLLDNGKPGSLRYAVDDAPPSSKITFDTSLHGIILLTNGDLNIAKDLTIQGPGPGILSISGGDSGFSVHVIPGTTVTIANLAFKGNVSSSGFIENDGTLTLSNSIVSGNLGVGISNSGTLTLNNSIVSNNTGDGGPIILSNGATNNAGGGISNAGILTLNNSTVSNNLVTGFNSDSDDYFPNDGGGGISNAGILTLNNSSISNNSVAGLNSSGGGVLNTGGLTLNNSTISNNTVDSPNSSGGGISNNSNLMLNNSTISGNTASGDGSNGGGIFVQSIRGLSNAEIHLKFCTLYGNTANTGGEIAIDDVSNDSDGNTKPIKQVSAVTIQNSIVASNPTHSDPDIIGTFVSLGHNLFVNTSGAAFDLATQRQHDTDKTISVNNVDTLFASPVELRENGGPTKTLALAPNSPAIDQIPLAACHINGITTDQRGMNRPDGNENVCDIGAFETS
jgi:transcriptional regulator with XRE-family HTH domain